MNSADCCIRSLLSHEFAMTRNHEDTLACPLCGEAMKLLIVRKQAPDEETLVLQCRRCGVSTTLTRKRDAAGTIAH